MAKLKRDSLPQNGIGWGSWFATLGSSYISVSGDTVIIANDFIISVESSVVNINRGGSLLATMTCGGAVTITAVIDAHLVYIQGNDTANRRFVFIYEEIGNRGFYSVYGSGSTDSISYMSIASLTFVDVDSAVEYTHTPRLNFSTPVGNVFFAPEALFQDSIRDITDTNFVACSTLGVDQIYCFALKNFYSVGANTLVRLDIES